MVYNHWQHKLDAIPIENDEMMSLGVMTTMMLKIVVESYGSVARISAFKRENMDDGKAS